MRDWAIQIINEYGYWGIMMLTALESIFPIVPAEVILTFSGFMTTYTKLSSMGVIIYATAGELIGALILYSIGRFIAADRIENITDWKISHLIKLKKEDIYKAKIWFAEKGKYSVLFGRCIPVLGSLLSVPAGMAKMNIITFVVFTLIGISIWNTVLVTLGVAAKTSWEIIVNGADTFTSIIAYVFIISVIVNLILLYRKHKHINQDVM